MPLDADVIDEKTWEEVRRLRKCIGDFPAGITSPDVDLEAGEVVHTTLTGRLRWRVGRDGTAVICVHRPNYENWVLRAAVGPEGSARLEVQPDPDSPPFYGRHLRALTEAVRALNKAWSPLPDLLSWADSELDPEKKARFEVHIATRSLKRL